MFLNLLDVDISIEHLSLNFDKLENIHYGLLKKLHEGKGITKNLEDIISPIKSAGTDIIKQNLPDDGFDRLQALKTAFHNETHNLKKLLAVSFSNTRPITDAETLRICQSQVESNVESLKTRILAAPELKEAGKSLFTRVHSLFELTSKDISLAFSYLRPTTESGGIERDNIDRIMDLCHMNSETFNNIGDITSSLKKKIVASYNQMHSSELLYNKEAQSLKTTLDQIKSQLKELEQGNRMQENLKIVIDLVDKSAKIDIEKNKLFSGAKNETENTFKKITNQLMEIMSRVENSGAKNKNLESIAAQEQNHETDFLVHQIVVTPAEKRNLSIPASSTRISSALSPNLTADLFRKRNNSPNSKLLIDPASKSSTSPSRQNLFSPSPMTTSRKSFINNRNSPLRSAKQKSPKSVNEEEQLRKYVGTVTRMKDDLKDCSKNLLRAVKRVIDSTINNERVNKFVLHTLTDSQNSFERLVKELEGITYQGKFIYPFGYTTNRHSSTENIYKDMKYGFKSQSPTKKTHLSSASATDLYNRLNLDEKHIPTSKAELLLWSMQERWRNQEEPHKDIESERNLAPVMDKIEKLVELVETQYERKYTALYAKLGQKEHKLECLEAELAKLKNSKEVVVSQTSENSRSDNAVVEKKYASLLKKYEYNQEQQAKQQAEHQEHIQTLNEKIMELSKLNEKQREAREASAKAESIKIQDHSQNMIEKENKLRQEGEEKLRQLREEFESKIKKQVEQHNSLVETYKDQIDSLNTEKEVLEKNVEEKQAQIVILSNAIESNQGSNTSQISALKTEKEAVKKSLEEKQNQITSLTKELEGVRNLNVQLEKELAETKSYVNTLEEATVHVEEQVAKIVTLTKEKEDLQAHLSLLEAGIIDKQEEIVHLREAYETATSKLQEEMTEDAVVLMKERDESREKNREIEKRIRILEGEVERAQEKNSSLVEENANLVEAQQEALAKVQELQEQLRVRSGETKKLNEEIKVLKEENVKIVSEKDLIKQISTKQEEEIAELKKKLTEEAELEITELSEEVKVLKEENTKISSEKDLIKQTSTKQEEEISELKKKLAEIEKNHDMTVSKYQEDLQHAETQNKLTSDKYNQSQLQEKEQIERLNKDIVEKEKEIERVKSQLLEKDQTHQVIVNKFEEEIAALKIRLDKLLTNEKTEVEHVPAFKNPFEPIREETDTSPEPKSEERDPFGLEGEGEERAEKTAFSLANSVVSFEYQTQQGESNVFDRKAQFSTYGEPKLHFRSIENGKIDEESTPKSRSKSNITPVNLDDRDVSFEADDSEARDQVNPFDKSDAFKHEKTAFSLAGSVVSFEYLTQQGESIMLDAKKGQFSAFGDHFKFDYNASHIGQKMKEELKALQDQINELKKEKAALEEECEKYIKYKDENSSIEQMHSEIKELKAFLTQKDIEISNFKMISSRASVDAGKAKEEYEKKIYDLSEEVKELKEKKTQFEKSQEIQPHAELGLKKMTTADFKKEFESFEFSEMNPWKQSQADFSQASFSESQISIDKYKKDNKRLREDRRHLRDENDELRKSLKVFQEQIVTLSEIQKSSVVVSKDSKDESSEILKIVKDAFAEICMMETLKERTNVKLNNKKEAKETLQAFKKALQENEEDMLELVKELEEYDRAHDEIEHTKEKLRQKDEEMNRKIADANLILQEGRNRIQEEVDLLEGDMNERLLKTHKELESIIKDYMIADLNSEVLKVSGEDGFEKTEKMVFACIDVLREYIEIATEVQDNYEKLLAETQEKEPKNGQPNQLGHSVSKKSDEEEEMKESLEVPSPLKKKTLKRDNTMDQLRKFLPRSSISESVRPITPDGEETPEPHFPEPQIANIRDVGNQEHVKSLYEQIRVLQDENEKLQEEAKQVDHEFAMLKFVRDDLKAELIEKDDQIKDLERKLDKALASLEKNDDKQQLIMEKDHIKSIFVKFMQSAINGQKDAAFELLKMLMSLLKLSEEDQQWLVEVFKKKSKKGVFGKLFK